MIPKATLLQFVLALSVIAFGCNSLPAQDKTDREKAELVGPVATVTVESTFYERENGKWVESQREFYAQSEYDRSGKLVNRKKPVGYGDPAPCTLQYKYDDRHRTTETFCIEGTREKIFRKYTYEDDRFGNWIKQVSFVPDGDNFRAGSTTYRTITYFQ